MVLPPPLTSDSSEVNCPKEVPKGTHCGVRTFGTANCSLEGRGANQLACWLLCSRQAQENSRLHLILHVSRGLAEAEGGTAERLQMLPTCVTDPADRAIRADPDNRQTMGSMPRAFHVSRKLQP